MRTAVLAISALVLSVGATSFAKPNAKAATPPLAKPEFKFETLDAYNSALIDFGVSWPSGSSGYYPSFYTGFAPHTETPSRVHVRLGRGNQARLTLILDEYTVLTYLYNLRKRAEVYTSLIGNGVIKLVAAPQVNAFRTVVSSPVYNVLGTAEAYEGGRLSREALYEAGLDVMKKLNPGRVFPIRIDLAKAIRVWRDETLKPWVDRARAAGATDGSSMLKFIDKDSRAAIVAANDLLFGRINVTFLTGSQKAKLAQLALALGGDETAFVGSSIEFFKDLTSGKYDFRVVEDGHFRPALDCAKDRCELFYTEFTAIYPVGSVRATTSDRDGNVINVIQESGAMKFVARSYHDVDHIRNEPYYGWIPKMDYTMDGNGLHNPAVRTWLEGTQYSWLYGQFHIPKTDDTLWIVSRGGVSHGCTRVAAGHINEIRSIFPANPATMTEIVYTGNLSVDYDLFDIDGDGKAEVMGVDYLIAYNLVGNTGDGYREANGLIAASLKKDEFYPLLYGRNRQFQVVGGHYVFTNPSMSYFGGDPGSQRAAAFSVARRGDFPLYEQAYEKDKLQLYVPPMGVGGLSGVSNNTTSTAAQFVRLLGRINGCGPFVGEYKACFQAGFEKEMNALVARVH